MYYTHHQYIFSLPHKYRFLESSLLRPEAGSYTIPGIILGDCIFIFKGVSGILSQTSSKAIRTASYGACLWEKNVPLDFIDDLVRPFFCGLFQPLDNTSERGLKTLSHETSEALDIFVWVMYRLSS